MMKVKGAIGGLIAGLIVCLICRHLLGWGLTIFPMADLCLQLLPGLLAGFFLGICFPRFFGFFTNFVP